MYKYTLEPVLSHRKTLEENLQKEMAVCKRLLANEKKRLWIFEKSRTNLLKEMQQKQQENITISEIILYLSFIEQLSKDLEKQKERVSEFENEMEQKREDLVEAMKNRKTLEKLRDKGLDAYRQDMMRKEQGFMDEMAINGFNRGF